MCSTTYSMGNQEKSYDKWTQPGWRIEQKYANNVLIGNWVEDKFQFTRECKTANSTNRADYQPQWDHRPDVILRREALRKAEGLPAKLLLSHHGTLPSHYLVTLYDEMYGRQGTSTLPPLRSWHPDRLAWTPEKSDHPSLAPPTNFGLVESRQVRLDQQQSPLPALSVYRSAYQKYPLSAFCQPRFASVPRGHSSKLHPANRINKDMDLKQRPCRQVPDNSVSASILPPLSVV
ncbi:cilia- and flagella-associated protein 107 isoform X1 [Oncorhynchus keta]|uniref:uncharacterized protein C1orf158-like n=1 Tax=Oncorhynchus gorbuscha TaxID=8017 RepID=UPI0015FE3D69|nr:cilia- and flagella-associated protein 107 isoform X1 [Oncorhynchus keta]XP_046168636.1 uncharacterized protein C1orf158-like [Oncorhynchus gorbuscha]